MRVVARADEVGKRRLIAYVVPVVGACSGWSDVREQEQVDERKGLYELLYQASDSSGYGEGFAANSSYDGQPIPLEDLRAWRDATVEQIRRLRPRRVLEIGVRSGLILSEVASACETYWGADVSEEAIVALRRRTAEVGLAERVELRVQPAHDVTDLPDGFFDTVIINSLVQHFPSVDYLIDVLRKVVNLLIPGGAVFVGDVRNLRLLRCLRAAVELHRIGTHPTPAELPAIRFSVEAAVAWERELLLDPDFFPALRHLIPDIGGVDLRIKRALCHNEFSRYRYDVVLRKVPSPPSPEPAPELNWGTEIDGLEGLTEHLTLRRPAKLRIVGIPNARLASDLSALRELGEESALGAALRTPDGGNPANAMMDPEALHELGAGLGYRVVTTWSGERDDGSVDVEFADARADTEFGEIYRPARNRSIRSLGNSPAVFPATGALLKSLRSHATRWLPAHMVPAAFVPLPWLPVLPNGKLDRAALPAPDFGALSTGHRPRSAREELLCELYAEVLGVPATGINDDFYALGGDSIVSIQLVIRARQVGLVITPRQVFTHRTVAELAPLATAVADTVAEPPEVG
ncbi:MAG: phosphopantetheine-binding protein, partial [Pseudonocardiaceae bacterium]